MKDIDEVLPRLLLLEQTLITLGYREIQLFERELGVDLIVEGSQLNQSARDLSDHPSRSSLTGYVGSITPTCYH